MNKVIALLIAVLLFASCVKELDQPHYRVIRVCVKWHYLKGGMGDTLIPGVKPSVSPVKSPTELPIGGTRVLSPICDEYRLDTLKY